MKCVREWVCFPELTVTGKDLKDCGKNVCVMSNAKCPTESDVLTATPGASALMSLTRVYPHICSWFSFNVHLCSLERFVNTSCHFLSRESRSPAGGFRRPTASERKPPAPSFSDGNGFISSVRHALVSDASETCRSLIPPWNKKEKVIAHLYLSILNVFLQLRVCLSQFWHINSEVMPQFWKIKSQSQFWENCKI